MEILIKRFILADKIVEDDLFSVLSLMNLNYEIKNKDLIIKVNKDKMLDSLFGLINEMARFNLTLRLMYFNHDKQRMICELEV